jgi:undecaprenyl-diphosphatase
LEPIQAVILGIVQGLTEFLPVSSSGHLVIFQYLFGLNKPELVFDIAVHVGTLIAVVIFFKKDLLAIIVAFIQMAGRMAKGKAGPGDAWADPDVKLGLLIVLGSIPTALIGLGFHQVADRIFSSVPVVGCMLLITGSVLWASRWTAKTGHGVTHFTIGKALLVGFVQGVAILPGISRSGSTIVLGLFLGLERDLAARYSFLLSLPAISGAALLAVRDVSRGGDFSIGIILTGLLSAAVVGYLSLKLLVFIVNKGQLHFFSPYCWIIGGLALFL